MIKVQYTCEVCGIKNRPVLVPFRTDEDIVVWTKVIMAGCISDDHLEMSPRCPAKAITQIMIPLPKGSEGVGMEPVP